MSTTNRRVERSYILSEIYIGVLVADLIRVKTNPYSLTYEHTV
jgi:hypothetical protein